MNTFNIFDTHMIIAFILYLVISVFVLARMLRTILGNNTYNTELPLEEIEILIEEIENVKPIKTTKEKE